ncbi:hypothetical protein [Paenibacillus spiritus]|uniref:hypothetical protein n=1 Tax=Paenibacillus spiritus TaxID=2496557 RepID=UPI00123DB3F7|nr:hypothetical protein [Paenibacillus spiritus]
MQYNLLVSDNATYDQDSQTYKLGKLLRSVSLPTVPFVIPLYVIGGASYLSLEESYDTQFIIYDSKERIVAVSERKVVRNQYRANRTPGFQLGYQLLIAFYAAETHHCCFFVNDKPVFWYPLAVELSADQVDHLPLVAEPLPSREENRL